MREYNENRSFRSISSLSQKSQQLHPRPYSVSTSFVPHVQKNKVIIEEEEEPSVGIKYHNNKACILGTKMSKKTDRQ